jgi:hypothetical protein
MFVAWVRLGKASLGIIHPRLRCNSNTKFDHGRRSQIEFPKEGFTASDFLVSFLISCKNHMLLIDSQVK